jgi:predicted DNA binding CopG/RHH family protein
MGEKEITWNFLKAERLKKSRGVSFEELLSAKLVAVKNNPARGNSMRKVKLSRAERAVEDALARGEYRDVSKKDFDAIAKAITLRKKDAVLNIRVNSGDLQSIKQKAMKMGVRYQTFISEVIHKIATV